MTIENNPKNQKPNGPHDLGQITYQATPERMAIIFEWMKDNQTDFDNSADLYDTSYYGGFRAALQCVLEALRGDYDTAPTATEIREGMADFIGPLRRVWHFSRSSLGDLFDCRCTTGGDKWQGKAFRTDFHYEIADLDAPRLLPAGCHHTYTATGDDPDNNVFPSTTYRNL